MSQIHASAERVQLFESAFERVKINSGTPYPCRQEELDSYRHLRVPNRQRQVSARAAGQEIVDRNSEKRQRSDFQELEWNAMKRLSRGMNQSATSGFSSDIVIKMFADLDLVFFNGALLGNTKVSWDKKSELSLGCFGGTRPIASKNQCEIILNPQAILLRQLPNRSPFRQMISTMLHEMCHAYRMVRCPLNDQGHGDGHDSVFRCMIHAVHRRALDNLGSEVIAPSEEYFYHHPMSHKWEKEEGGSLYGPHLDGPVRGPQGFQGDGAEIVPGSSSFGGVPESGGFGGYSLGAPGEYGGSMLGDILGYGSSSSGGRGWYGGSPYGGYQGYGGGFGGYY